MKYPLLQAYRTQDRIRGLMESAYECETHGMLIEAADLMFKAREAINRTTGNKNVARVVASEAKRLRKLSADSRMERFATFGR